MHPQIEQIHHALVTATSWMRQDDLLPGTGSKWSAAQIVEHLDLTYSGTAGVMQSVQDTGTPSAGSPSLRQTLAAWLIIEIGYFPPGRQAPPQVQPKGELSPDLLRLTFENLRIMDAAITACERRFGPSTALCDHPVLGGLSAARWRKFHLVHSLHHSRQLQALAVRPAVP